MYSRKRPSSPTDSLMDERDATRLKQATLGCDDAIESRWVDAVFETVGDYDPSDKPSTKDLTLTSFLATIVSKSEGRLDSKYENFTAALALLKKDPELMEKLRVAWKERTLKEISSLPILRAPAVTKQGVSMELKNILIEAWKLNFLGRADEVLLKALDELHQIPLERNYAKILPVTQSSGTGKSKTVDRIATKRILFPLCLREDIGKDSFAYPPADISIRDHLLRAPKASEEVACKGYLRLFLNSLFTVARGQAEMLVGKSTHRTIGYVELVGLFYHLFSDSVKRSDFYDKVIDGARVANNATRGQVSASFQDLERYLKKICSDWPSEQECPILISMDEVHVLFGGQGNTDDSTHTLYSRLKSVLSEVISKSFCVVVLSTVTSITRLAPSRDVVPSLREREDDRKLPSPFTELPFDAYIINERLVPERETLQSVGSLRFCAKFGRPLFYSLYLSRNKEGYSDDHIVVSMMRIIREKLYGRTWPPDSPAKLNPSSIAVLSARLSLDLSPTTLKARRYEAEQVRSHLRMLYSVREDRQVMVTGTSPEPLLAEAAAQIMHHPIIKANNTTSYINMWELLMDFIEEGLLDQGTAGELIGRALSIAAMDRAIDKLKTHYELRYQTPVPVAAYYKALLTDEAWEKLRRSIPSNYKNLTEESCVSFENAFDNAYLHFSHYSKANDTTPLTDRYAWALWLRGTAVLCQLHQKLTDRAIPIYFSNLGPVGPKTMSMILDQDKAGQSADHVQTKVQSASALGVFSEGRKLPYIAAVHCYALTSKQGVVTKQPSRHDKTRQDEDQEAPRYQIDISGLLPYRDIDDDLTNHIRAMIDHSQNSLFIHHPRQYGLPLLRQMQPLLDGHANTTAWFGGLTSGKAGEIEEGLSQM